MHIAQGIKTPSYNDTFVFMSLLFLLLFMYLSCFKDEGLGVQGL